jgi:hypothetical protein
MSTGKQLLTLPGSLPHPSSGYCSQVIGLLDPDFQSLLMGAHKMPCLLIEITNSVQKQHAASFNTTVQIRNGCAKLCTATNSTLKSWQAQWAIITMSYSFNKSCRSMAW